MQEVPFSLDPVLTALLSLFFVGLLGVWLYVFYRNTSDVDAPSPASARDPEDLLPSGVRDRLTETPVQRTFGASSKDVSFDPDEFESDSPFNSVSTQDPDEARRAGEAWPPSLEQIEWERKTADYDWGAPGDREVAEDEDRAGDREAGPVDAGDADAEAASADDRDGPGSPGANPGRPENPDRPDDEATSPPAPPSTSS
jgi:hypothetical protein